MGDPEPLLLIYDQKPQVLKLHILGKDLWVPMTISTMPLRRSSRVRFCLAGVQNLDSMSTPHREILHPLDKCIIVLLS